MKNIILLFLLFVTVLPAVGQTDSLTKKPAFKNQIDVDVEFLGVSFGYQRRSNRNWLVGVNAGLGYSLHLAFVHKTMIDESISVREFAHLGVPFKYENNRFQFVIEPRYTMVVGSNNLGFVFGIGTGFYYGRVIQLGIRTMVGVLSIPEYSSSDFYLSSSLLIIRIPIKW